MEKHLKPILTGSGGGDGCRKTRLSFDEKHTCHNTKAKKGNGSHERKIRWKNSKEMSMRSQILSGDQSQPRKWVWDLRHEQSSWGLGATLEPAERAPAWNTRWIGLVIKMNLTGVSEQKFEFKDFGKWSVCVLTGEGEILKGKTRQT